MSVQDIHVGDLVPRIGVEGHTTAVVLDPARPVLLEETDHAGAPGLVGT